MQINIRTGYHKRQCCGLRPQHCLGDNNNITKNNNGINNATNTQSQITIICCFLHRLAFQYMRQLMVSFHYGKCKFDISFQGEPLEDKATTAGLITEFNMWSYEMSVDELNTKTCSAQGDVVSWTGTGPKWGTLTEAGSSTPITDYVVACSGKVFTTQNSIIIDVLNVANFYENFFKELIPI